MCVLYQNIDNHDLKDLTHKVKIEKGSFLDKIYHSSELQVNSYHHQSIKNVAPGFNIAATATSDDKIVEAIEKRNIKWHPESIDDIEFFKYFIEIIKQNA